jgi:hypothetical protein
LTLAEVEVYSDGNNVARRGKAAQKNTAHGGAAERAIDGNTSGTYGDGGQTHTEEVTPNPWWQVDLGAEVPIESVVVFNRTEDDFAKRLDGFTLKVLDAAHNVVFEEDKLPAPAHKAKYDVSRGGSPEEIVRRAAMNALTYVRGQEVATFKTLAQFVREGIDRHAAIQALGRIPTTMWPKEEIPPLLDNILAFIRDLPNQERTSPTALDALQLGDSLAATLPLADAKRVRRALGELGVRVIRLGTVPEQMIFDKERLAVAANKRFEVVF